MTIRAEPCRDVLGIVVWLHTIVLNYGICSKLGYASCSVVFGNALTCQLRSVMLSHAQVHLITQLLCTRFSPVIPRYVVTLSRACYVQYFWYAQIGDLYSGMLDIARWCSVTIGVLCYFRD